MAKISEDTNCVQVRRDNVMIAIGNSRFPDGLFLSYTKVERAAFLDGVKKGEFDDLQEVKSERKQLGSDHIFSYLGRRWRANRYPK